MQRSGVNDKQMWAKINATKRAAVAAREAGGKELGGAFVEAVDELTAKDTNRLSNGWIDAGRKAGVSDRPLRPIVASKSQDKFLEKLDKEIGFWVGRIRFAQSRQRQYEQADANAKPTKSGKPRKKRVNQPYYRKMQRLEREGRKNIVRINRELDKALEGDGFIFFDVDSIVQRRQGRSISTVRSKVYGGVGRTLIRAQRVIVELTNKEPHGNIVERHPFMGHPVATSLAIVRRFGIKKVGHAYKDRLRAGSPMASSKTTGKTTGRRAA